MMRGYIYRHYIKIDGVEYSYIGKTIQNPYDRWDDGFGYIYGKRKTKFAKAIIKYGWDNFHHEIIDEINHDNKVMITIMLKKLEIKYIQQYNSIINGFNTRNEKITCISNIRNIVRNTHRYHYSLVSHENPRTAIKIVCLTTSEVFNSTQDARRAYNIKSCSRFSKCLNKEVLFSGKHPITGEKLMWAKKSEVDEKGLEVVKQEIMEKFASTNCVYICINDGKKYSTLKEISNVYSISISTLSKLLNGKLENNYLIGNDGEQLYFKKETSSSI